MVNRAYKPDELAAEVDKIAAQITKNSFEGIVAIKRLYDEGFATTLAAGLELELAASSVLPDTDQRLAAFKAK